MSRRKLVGGLAALAAAGSMAVPAASASAQVTPKFVYTPPYVFCAALVPQIQFAVATGNLVLASAISNVFVYSGCGGAAI
jgi:hypothetical protein